MRILRQFDPLHGVDQPDRFSSPPTEGGMLDVLSVRCPASVDANVF